MTTSRTDRSLQVELPYPPTANTYYRSVGPRMLLSWRGREYRKAVAAALVGATRFPHPARLDVYISVWTPDRRKRDLDNLPKGLLDALQHAGIFDDDSQIDCLTIEREGVKPGGVVVVTVAVREDVA